LIFVYNAKLVYKIKNNVIDKIICLQNNYNKHNYNTRTNQHTYVTPNNYSL